MHLELSPPLNQQSIQLPHSNLNGGCLGFRLCSTLFGCKSCMISFLLRLALLELPFGLNGASCLLT
jgi:hypothetical protein